MEDMKRHDEVLAAATADAEKNGRFKIHPPYPERAGLTFAELREWMERNDDRLAHCVADVPNHWRKFSMPNMRFPGDCFRRAIQFFNCLDQRTHSNTPLFMSSVRQYVVAVLICSMAGWKLRIE